MEDITIVYLEAVLMPNNEVIHYGKSLGFISGKQADLVKAQATKLTKGNEIIVAVGNNVA